MRAAGPSEMFHAARRGAVPFDDGWIPTTPMLGAQGLEPSGLATSGLGVGLAARFGYCVIRRTGGLVPSLELKLTPWFVSPPA